MKYNRNHMDKVYLVEANYEDWESSWTDLIGLFFSKKNADDAKEKWDKFYIDNKSIFDEPKDWEPGEEDYVDEIEEWGESHDYYTLTSKYDEILKFRDITIIEYPINSDVFSNNTHRTEPMKELLTQHNRDYKLNKIL